MLIAPLLLLSMAGAPAPVIIHSSAGNEYRQPQVVVEGKQVDLTFGAQGKIFFVKSSDGGLHFGNPLEIASVAKMDLGRHRGPRIARAGKALVITSVVTDQKMRWTGDLVAWRSEDDGKTWSAPVRVNDHPDAAREGLHGLASNGTDLLVAVWLDHRALLKKQPDAGTQLYSSTSTDGGRTWTKNILAYSSPSHSICQCCHPNAIVTKDGEIVVMFRNELDGARDEYVIRSKDRGATFEKAQKLGSGTWQLNACPMDGGDLAADKRGNIISVWRREKTIFTAFDSRTEQKLGSGKDASVAVGHQGTYTVWTAPQGLVVRRPGSPVALLLDPKGGFGQLVPMTDGAVIATWETPDGIAVDVLDDARLSSLPPAPSLPEAMTSSFKQAHVSIAQRQP